ncbi:hypothetical protein yaldo0001_18590 [Yersinia aldovae ATCC 35236]|nr:hypothetical protein yaldo0001_18590 [Yersinia aldovae ATCC 35236]
MLQNNASCITVLSQFSLEMGSNDGYVSGDHSGLIPVISKSKK